MKELIDRIKISCGYESEAAIARAMEMSPQNFLSRKKSGGIKEALIRHAISKGANEIWLRTGQGMMKAAQPDGATYQTADDLHASVAAVISDVSAIMYSGNSGIISALTKNVQEFKRAVETANRLSVCEIELKEVRQEIADLRQQVDRLTAPPISVEGSDAS